MVGSNYASIINHTTVHADVRLWGQSHYYYDDDYNAQSNQWTTTYNHHPVGRYLRENRHYIVNGEVAKRRDVTLDRKCHCNPDFMLFDFYVRFYLSLLSCEWFERNYHIGTWTDLWTFTGESTCNPGMSKQTQRNEDHHYIAISSPAATIPHKKPTKNTHEHNVGHGIL